MGNNGERDPTGAAAKASTINDRRDNTHISLKRAKKNKIREGPNEKFPKEANGRMGESRAENVMRVTSQFISYGNWFVGLKRRLKRLYQYPVSEVTDMAMGI